MYQGYINIMTLSPILGILILVILRNVTKTRHEVQAANLSVFLFLSLTLLSGGALILMAGGGPKIVEMDHWITLKGYVFDLSFVLNWTSLLFSFISSLLFFTISYFSKTYLHGEEGSPRYYTLLLLFATGTYLISLTSSIDILFAGWELVGISSVLLIGYFNRRVQPVSNALKVFRIYKLCDVALLSAAVWLHIYFHTASLSGVPGHSSPQLTVIAVLIVFASLGKSAQFPFCNWLTMAIEGPTPSSTIFYGSISTHLGALLLIKAHPILIQSHAAMVLVIVIGFLSAVYATLVGRVQADIKSSLAYSTVSQVGIIYMEIGLGLTEVALIHILLHMCYRTYQFLWSPSIIDEYNLTEMAASSGNLIPGKHFSFLPEKVKHRIYFLALNKFHLNNFWIKVTGKVGQAMGQMLRLEESLSSQLIADSLQEIRGNTFFAILIKSLNVIFFMIVCFLLFSFYSKTEDSFQGFYIQLQLLISTLVTWLIIANMDESDGMSMPILGMAGYLLNLGLLSTFNSPLYFLFWTLLPLPVFVQIYLIEKKNFTLFSTLQFLSIVLLFMGILFESHYGIWGGFFFFTALMIRQAEFPFHSWLLSIKHTKFLPLVTQFLVFNSGVTIYLLRRPEGLNEYSTWMTILAMFSGLYLSMLGWRSVNFVQKAVLIVFSQSSLVLAGIESFSESAIGGSIVYQLAHALGGTCFLIVLNSVIKHKRITEGGKFFGIGHKQPLQALIFLLSGLVMVGCPLTLGFIGEDVLFHTLLETYPILGFNLIIITALNSFNIFTLYSEIFLGPEQRNWMPFSLRKREVSSYVLTIMILITLGLAPKLFVWKLNHALERSETSSEVVIHEKKLTTKKLAVQRLKAKFDP